MRLNKVSQQLIAEIQRQASEIDRVDLVTERRAKHLFLRPGNSRNRKI